VRGGSPAGTSGSPPRLPLALALAAAALAFWASAGAAADSSAHAPLDLPEPGDERWRPLGFIRVEKPTVYRIIREPNAAAAFAAVSQCGASGMSLPLRAEELAGRSRLSWEWRVEKDVSERDERSRKGDDFAARVYLLYEFRAEEASLGERLRHRVGQLLRDRPIPGRARTFIWASREPLGSRWTNPYAAEAEMIVLRTDAGNAAGRGWQTEVVDLAAALPGRRRADEDESEDLTPARAAAPEPFAIALMTDSDDTCSEAAASYRNFRLLPASNMATAPSPSAQLDPSDRSDAGPEVRE